MADGKCLACNHIPCVCNAAPTQLATQEEILNRLADLEDWWKKAEGSSYRQYSGYRVDLAAYRLAASVLR